MTDVSAFDRAEEYRQQLAGGLRLSGEDQAFFVRGRMADLVRRLPPGARPTQIVDFGCGLGDTTVHLAQVFPSARVTGVDTAEEALDHARKTHGGTRISFAPLTALADRPDIFDLVYVNGVFHHIPPADRPGQLAAIRRSLRPGGHLALFENNPWNPGARMVMRRIPFDRDAEMISPRGGRRLLRDAGFSVVAAASLFWFPRALSPLRRLEPALARIPLGAQYHLLAQRPDEA